MGYRRTFFGSDYPDRPIDMTIDLSLKVFAEHRGLLVESSGPASLGYHSAIVASPDVTKWVQVDLGRSLAIDRIVLVPAHVAYGGWPGPGFGFPARFREEGPCRAAASRVP